MQPLAQEAPGVPVVSLSHEIEIEGSLRLVSAAFSPDGDTLYLHTHTRALDAWSATVHGWPEWGGGLTGLIVLLAALWIGRVLARRQRRGEPHCRKCNYNLSGTIDSGSTQETPNTTLCPECGSDFTRCLPRRGRSTRRRIAIPIALGLFFLICYGTLLLAGVPRDGTVSAWRFWPSKQMTAWAERNNIKWLDQFIGNHDEVLAIDCDTGVVSRSVAIRPGRSRLSIVLSPDGSRLFRSTRRGVESFSVVTGRRVSHTDLLGLTQNPSPGTAASVVGFRDDGREVIVTGWSGKDEASVVVAWDQDSGAVRELLAVPAVSDASRMPAMSVVANRASDPSRLVFTSGFGESYDRKRCRVIVCGLDEQPTVLHEYEFATGPMILPGPFISIGAVPVVSPDGLRAFVSAGTVLADVLGIDLETGEPLGLLRSPISGGTSWDALSLSADGRLLAYSTVTSDRLLVRDVIDARWVAQCPYPEKLVNPEPTLSPSGRRLAAIGTYSTWGPQARQFHKVLVIYDLRPVLASAETPPAEQ